MAKTYRSKIDTWLMFVLVAAMAAASISVVTALSARGSAGWWALFPALIGIGLPLWVLTSTYYRFEDDVLIVRSGPFRWRVPVAKIKAVQATSNPLSSPALSLDRLRIEYGNGRSIMISPAEKEEFLADLERSRRSK